MDYKHKGDTRKHENQNIICVEFDNDSTCFWLGTERGNLICISVDSGQEIGKPFAVTPEIEKPITSMCRFSGIETEEIFLLILNKREASVYRQKKADSKPVDYGESEQGLALVGKEICNAKTAYNGKYFIIGFPSARTIGFFSFDKETFTFKPVKFLEKYAFADFITDAHLSQIMLIDDARKTMDHHIVLWEFDTSKLDDKALKRIDNQMGKVGSKSALQMNSTKGGGSKESGEDDDSGDEIDKNNRKMALSLKGSNCCSIF